MSDFTLNDSNRFEGDFALVAASGYSATQAEKAYLDRLTKLVTALSQDEMLPEPLADELETARLRYSQAVRREAAEFAAAEQPERDEIAVRALRNTYYFDGVYRERRSRIRDIPFSVEAQRVNDDSKGLVNDIVIKVFDAKISEARQRFKVEVDRTLTVMKTVLERRSQRSGESNDEKLSYYLTALTGAAEVGLMNLDKSQTPFAELSLKSLKEEFVAREGGIVKNDYLLKLGFAASIAVILSLIGYAVMGGFFATKTGIVTDYAAFRNFFLLWAGAAIGTWLSFSIRRVVLTFADLAVLEEDRLNPGFRILFMLALTTVIGLLFWTGMVSVTVGTFTTDFTAPGHGTTAFLIGALCGIAERSMASAVGRRAEDFAASVGSSETSR